MSLDNENTILNKPNDFTTPLRIIANKCAKQNCKMTNTFSTSSNSRMTLVDNLTLEDAESCPKLINMQRTVVAIRRISGKDKPGNARSKATLNVRLSVRWTMHGGTSMGVSGSVDPSIAAV